METRQISVVVGMTATGEPKVVSADSDTYVVIDPNVKTIQWCLILPEVISAGNITGVTLYEMKQGPNGPQCEKVNPVYPPFFKQPRGTSGEPCGIDSSDSWVLEFNNEAVPDEMTYCYTLDFDMNMDTSDWDPTLKIDPREAEGPGGSRGKFGLIGWFLKWIRALFSRS